MKKAYILIILSLVLSGQTYAQNNEPTEQDYQNLHRLEKKLVRMKHEMESFIQGLTASYPNQGNRFEAFGFGQDVRVDIVENPKDIVVSADLPGMDKDKIDIKLENGRILKISGSRDVAKEIKQPGVVRQERMRGSFERVVELPAECETSGVRATYKNGVLELVIPKKEIAAEKAVQISVQ